MFRSHYKTTEIVSLDSKIWFDILKGVEAKDLQLPFFYDISSPLLSKFHLKTINILDVNRWYIYNIPTHIIFDHINIYLIISPSSTSSLFVCYEIIAYIFMIYITCHNSLGYHTIMEINEWHAFLTKLGGISWFPILRLCFRGVGGRGDVSQNSVGLIRV